MNPVLETARLTLREMSLADLDFIDVKGSAMRSRLPPTINQRFHQPALGIPNRQLNLARSSQARSLWRWWG